MNVDDPKLTAYALGELSESERTQVEKLVADSPDAQHFVRELQDLARMLRAEYAGSSQVEPAHPANLIDIRDDPWLWSRARPLAVAAVIASAALIGAIILGPHNLRNNTSANAKDQPGYIQLENIPTGSAVALPAAGISNPFSSETIARAERVVVGEIPPDGSDSRTEIHVIEVISDSNRLAALKNRLGTNRLSGTVPPESMSRGYELLFVDKAGAVIAAARFCSVPGIGLTLQLSKNAEAVNGRYFVGNGTPVLPAEWKPGVDYSPYVIPFPDWQECIGYSPGA